MKIKLTVEYYPDGVSTGGAHSQQEKTFENDAAAIEWCRRNYRSINKINNYKTRGMRVSHWDLMDAINGEENSPYAFTYGYDFGKDDEYENNF